MALQLSIALWALLWCDRFQQGGLQRSCPDWLPPAPAPKNVHRLVHKCGAGFENTGAVGSDPVKLLQDALHRQGMNAKVGPGMKHCCLKHGEIIMHTHR